MAQCRLLLESVLFLIVCRVIVLVRAFNLDPVNYAVFEQPRAGQYNNSMFGFTVAVHKERNIGW